MTWTFDECNIATDEVAQVRLESGLTDPGFIVEVSDEIIKYYLSKRDPVDILGTARDVLEYAIRASGQFTDRDTGDVSESLSQLKECLESVLKRIEEDSNPVELFVSGLDLTDYDPARCDNTVYQGFKIGTETIYEH